MSEDLCRLATFASCPRWPSVSPVILARCGFIYDGFPDHLLCQHCGFRLRGWLETHRDPIVEHCCPTPNTDSEDLTLNRVSRDNPEWTIYTLYLRVLARAAENGVLVLANTRGRATRDRLGHAPVGDDVISGDNSSDAKVLKLKLSLAAIYDCPYCVWWRQ